MDLGFSQAELAWGDSIIGEDDIRNILQGIKDIGGTRVRFGVGWNLIEKTRGQYDWTYLDRAVNLCAVYGLRPLLDVLPAGSLKGGGDGTPADFGQFCAAMATRYGPSGTNLVDCYEIWNEENWSQFFTPTTPAAYMEYLKAAYTGIKSVHSSATVITGGTTPGATYSGPAGIFFWVHVDLVNHIDWYTGLYNLGVQDYCDGIGIHWYSAADNWSVQEPNATQIDYTRVQAVRDLMVAKGDGAKKIWLTECGFGQNLKGGVTKARDWLKLQMDMIQARPWIGPVFIYSYRNVGTDLSNPNNGYGVVDYKYNIKSPYYEYVKSLSQTFTPPSIPANVSPGDISSSSVRLTWDASTGDVTNYRVYTAGGRRIADTGDTTAILTGLAAGLSQGFYVVAVDHSGVESAPSSTLYVTTDTAPGRQAFNSYNFAGSASIPAVFAQTGLGFTVTSDVALPNAPVSDGEYWTSAPYTTDQASPDHTSRIAMATGPNTYGGTSAFAAVRMSTDGSSFVAATSDWGGTDSVQIVTSISGVVTVRNGVNCPPLNAGDELWCTAVGPTYTASRRLPSGEIDDLVSWTDSDAVYPGASNLRTGFGWHHFRVAGTNYRPVGITGTWKGWDISPAATYVAAWELAIIDESNWADVLTDGEWELYL